MRDLSTRFAVGLLTCAALGAASYGAVMPAVADPGAQAAPAANASPGQSVTGPVVQAGNVLPALQRFCTPGTAGPSPAGSAAQGRPGPASSDVPPPRTDFQGLSSHDGQVRPPVADTSGSAGRFAFGEVINEAIGFFGKATGQPLCPVQPIQRMWAGTPCAVDTTDAVLRYDTLAHRWIVARPGGGSYCIAVSQGEDPAAGWFRYRFPISIPGVAAAGDFPKLSVWSNTYTYTARARTTEAPATGASFLGDYVIAFQRHAMLSGRPASAAEFLVPQTPAPADQFYFLPASAEGSAVSPGGAAAAFIEQFMGASARLDVWNLHVDWRNPGAAVFADSQELTVLPYTTTGVPPVTQPPIGGTPAPTLNAGARLAQPLVWRRIGASGAIFGAVTTAVPAAGGQRAGIRWFELRQAGGRWAVAQQGTFAPGDGNSRWLPSLNADQRGDLGLVFNVSGPGLAPSLHYTGRLASDRPGTLRSEQTLVDGEGSQGPGVGCPATGASCVFGDYSQTSIDPQDGCTFWMAGEYYPDQVRASAGDFATRIGSFRFPDCGGTGA